jgi:hypothetical protein
MLPQYIIRNMDLIIAIIWNGLKTPKKRPSITICGKQPVAEMIDKSVYWGYIPKNLSNAKKSVNPTSKCIMVIWCCVTPFHSVVGYHFRLWSWRRSNPWWDLLDYLSFLIAFSICMRCDIYPPVSFIIWYPWNALDWIIHCLIKHSLITWLKLPALFRISVLTDALWNGSKFNTHLPCDIFKRETICRRTECIVDLIKGSRWKIKREG